jgi:hypothetical protein
MNDERLRQMLQEGDPLAGATGLTPDEVHEMRRTVLRAVPAAAVQRRRLAPALALAGAAAVAVLAAVLALRPGSGAAPRPAGPPRIAAVPATAPRPLPQVLRSPEPLARGPLTAAAAPNHRRHHRFVAPEALATGARTLDTLAALEPARQEETAIREIQFSTPGGTRIIWTLAPGKSSQ